MNKIIKARLWQILKLVVKTLVVIFVVFTAMAAMSPSISKNNVHYSLGDIRSELHTGDLIFATGGFFMNIFPRLYENSPIYHFGMVFKDSHSNPGGKIIHKDIIEDELYIFEGHNKCAHDYLTDTQYVYDKFVLQKIDTAIREDQVYIWKPLHTIRKKNFSFHTLVKEMRKLTTKSLTLNCIDWFDKVYGNWEQTEEDNNHKLCSEGIVELYQKLKIIDNNVPAYKFSPALVYRSKPTFINGYFLGDPMIFTKK